MLWCENVLQKGLVSQLKLSILQIDYCMNLLTEFLHFTHDYIIGIGFDFVHILAIFLTIS